MGGHDENDMAFEFSGADAPATRWFVACEAKDETEPAAMKARATLLTSHAAVAGPRLCWSCTPGFLLALKAPASRLLGRSADAPPPLAAAAARAAADGVAARKIEGGG